VTDIDRPTFVEILGTLEKLEKSLKGEKKGIEEKTPNTSPERIIHRESVEKRPELKKDIQEVLLCKPS
jgi:hypothetical protein